MNSKLLILMLLLAPALAPAVQAQAMTAASFGEQKARIEAALADGKSYAEINTMQRKEVTGALNRIARLLDTAGSSDGLNKRQKIRIFNDQELINTILTSAAEDSQLICRRDKPVGSHFAQDVCETVAERRRLREASQQVKRSFPTNPLGS